MGAVRVERTGTARLVGRTERGQEILIGPAEAPGHITPGELLKLALAGCAALSVDFPVRRRLGADATLAIEIREDSDRATNRYAAVTERIELDLAGLDEPTRADLIQAMDRAIAQACTVQRSVEPGMRVEHVLVPPRDAAEDRASDGG